MPCYILKAGGTDKVKIGWADQDVEARRKMLQTAHWEDLVVLRVIDGGPWTERAMHKRFAANRIRREWFVFDLDMLTHVPVKPEVRVKPKFIPTIRGDATYHEDLLKVLGGKKAICRALSVDRQFVTKWHERGIPAKFWHEIVKFGASLPVPVIVTEERLARPKPTTLRLAA